MLGLDELSWLLRRGGTFAGLHPEGTRKKVADWKRGFYHVAIGAKVPIVPVALDFSTRRILIMPPFTPSGRMEQDLPLLKGLFHKGMARHPQNFWD